jgi:hypothetical protein
MLLLGKSANYSQNATRRHRLATHRSGAVLVPLCVAVLLAVCSLPAEADNKTLKSELEAALMGKTLVSRIMFGGRAIPRGDQADYGVNTLVYPTSGEISYRVEWGIIRSEVSPGEMLRRFEPGTSFQIVEIELKDDRLELKLQSGRGDSARLKLMLGAGWQSKFDLTSIQAQLARVFVFEQQSVPPEGSTAAASPKGAVSAPSISVSTGPGYRRDPNAAKIEGRISDEDMQAVLAGFDDENRRSLSTVSQDADVLSQSLIAFQKAYSGRSDYASRPMLQAILQLQDRLGQALRPQRDDDVLQMDEIFTRCVRISRMGQAYDERGNPLGAGRNSEAFQQLLLTGSAVEVSKRVPRDVQAASAQTALVERARASVIAVEQSLDKGDLSVAGEQYQQLSSDAQLSRAAGLQQYLQLTAGFREDIGSYLQVYQDMHHRELQTADQVQFLARELDALNSWQSRPLTAKLLRESINAEATLTKQKLAALPSLEVNEAAYSLPPGLVESRAPAVSEKLSFVEGRITKLDAKLNSVSDLRSVAAETDSLRKVMGVLGPSDTTALQRKIDDIAVGERLLAALTAARQMLQIRLAEERADEQKRVEAAQAEAATKAATASATRQQFAEILTKSMAGEIRWCATGQSNEILVGVVTTNRLSDALYSQMSAGSPLWKELFAKGFKFRAVMDTNKTTKIAAVRSSGGFAASMIALSDTDRGYLESAMASLTGGASGTQ